MDRMRAAIIALVARYDCVVLKKISMMGIDVGDCKAFEMSPMLKRMATLNPEQSTPLMAMLHTMPLGTTVAAFLTSLPTRTI